MNLEFSDVSEQKNITSCLLCLNSVFVNCQGNLTQTSCQSSPKAETPWILVNVKKKKTYNLLPSSQHNNMKSSDAKASKCQFSSLMMIFIKLVYLSSVISLK